MRQEIYDIVNQHFYDDITKLIFSYVECPNKELFAHIRKQGINRDIKTLSYMIWRLRCCALPFEDDDRSYYMLLLINYFNSLNWDVWMDNSRWRKLFIKLIQSDIGDYLDYYNCMDVVEPDDYYIN